MASKLAKYIALNIRKDPTTKKWYLASRGIFMSVFQQRNYNNIAAIFKSKPETFKVTETRTPEGKFRSFIVETK